MLFICTFVVVLLTVVRTKFMSLKAIRGFILGTENGDLNAQKRLCGNLASLVELTEGEVLNLSSVILTNSLRFQSLALSVCTYLSGPSFLFMFLGACM